MYFTQSVQLVAILLPSAAQIDVKANKTIITGFKGSMGTSVLPGYLDNVAVIHGQQRFRG